MKDNNDKIEQKINQSNDIYNSETKIFQDVIMKHEYRVRRMKWATIISWLLVVVSYIVTTILQLVIPQSEFQDSTGPFRDSTGPWSTLYMIVFIILMVSIIVSIYLTVSFYVRYKSSTMNIIQMRLSNIEESLRRIISNDKR